MALHTKKQLADLCDVSGASVSIAIRNQTLVTSGDYIDDSLDLNKIQINKWLERKREREANPHVKQRGRKKTATKKTPKKKLPNISAPDYELKSKPAPNVSDPVLPDEPEDRPQKKKHDENSWEFRKLKAETLEKEEKAKLAALKVAKERGKNMPIEVVDSLIKLVAHHMQNQYRISMENTLNQIAHKTKMSKENNAKFKGKIRDQINKAHRTALSMSKKEIKSHLSEIANPDDDEEKE